MKPSILAGIALATVAGVSGPIQAAPVPKMPLSIEQALAHERIGDVLVDPAGKWFIVMRYPGANRLPDYGVDLGRDGGTPMLVDAESGVVTPLPGIDPNAFYFEGAVSPGGTKLLFYEQRGKDTRLVVIDLATGTLKRLAQTPEYWNGMLNQIPEWVSDTHIAFTATNGSMPRGIGSRRNKARHLVTNWERSWSGLEPGVTVAESRPAEAGVWPGRLMIVNIETGESRVLADGGHGDLRVSPGGRYLAAALARKKSYKHGLRQRELIRFNASDPELVVFDLISGERHEPAPGETVDSSAFNWSADGTKLLFQKYHAGRDQSEGLVYVYEPATRKTTTLGNASLARALGAGPPISGDSPQAPSWIGSAIVMPGPKQGNGKGFDWYRLEGDGRIENLTKRYTNVSAHAIGSGKAGVYVLADGHVLLLANGGVRDLTPQLSAGAITGCRQNMVLNMAPVAGVGGTVCTVNKTKQRGSIVVDFDDATIRTVDMPAASDRLVPLAVSSRGSMIYRWFSDDGEELRLQPASGKARTVIALNSYLKNVIKPETRLVRYSSRGQSLASCIVLPPHYQPGRRYPAVVVVYPYIGPRSRCRTQGTYAKEVDHYDRLFEDQLAARGYVVLIFPANPQEVVGNEEAPLAHMAEMVNDAVDALTTQSYVDPDRVGIYGFSQGGYTSLWLATQADRYKAIVSRNGWADFVTHYLLAGSTMQLAHTGPFPGYKTRYEVPYKDINGSVGGLGKSLWDAPERYTQNSPIFLANKIKTPIMMIHSDMDGGFPMVQYDEMFAALSMLGKEATYVRYWGEGHGRASPANIKDEYERIFAFFDKYLKPQRTVEGRTIQSAAKHP